MSIIYQYDKRSGITYAYENKAFWDKEKKQSRAKRVLIGRVDPLTGEIVPTDGRHKKLNAKKEEGESPDYKSLYEELFKKHQVLEALCAALQNENRQLKQVIKEARPDVQ